MNKQKNPFISVNPCGCFYLKIKCCSLVSYSVVLCGSCWILKRNKTSQFLRYCLQSSSQSQKEKDVISVLHFSRRLTLIKKPFSFSVSSSDYLLHLSPWLRRKHQLQKLWVMGQWMSLRVSFGWPKLTELPCVKSLICPNSIFPFFKQSNYYSQMETFKFPSNSKILGFCINKKLPH